MADQVLIDTLVKEAMFNALDQEKRDELLKAAIGGLLHKEYRGYGDSREPLRKAFDDAVYQEARKLAHEHITGDSPEAQQIRGKIRELVVAGWERAMADPEELIGKIAYAIQKTLTGER